MFDNNRLKQRRLDMGLTLEEVGNVVGVSRSAIQKHEKGIIKNVYTSTVELFAKALRCSPAYLMCWTDDPTISEDIKTKVDSREEKLISGFRNLNEEGMEYMESQLEFALYKIEYKKHNQLCMGEEKVPKQA